MSEPVQQQPSGWRKALGCLLGLFGGGLAFVSLLTGVCGGLYGGFKGSDMIFLVGLAALGVLGIALLVYALRIWRRS